MTDVLRFVVNTCFMAAERVGILLLVACLALPRPATAAERRAPSVVPKPVRIERGEGAFRLKPTTRLLAAGQAHNVAAYLQKLLRPATGYSFPIASRAEGGTPSDTILLTTSGADQALGDEGYELRVTPDGIVIRAPRPAGLFYGVQTLRQLLPPDVEIASKVASVEWVVPAVTISDRPRFRWRGMHLDVARQMFPVRFIKRTIDLMALHKMNTFHWHLTDDEGWRIEIRKHPALTEAGGFYTQDEIREIVSYAQSRFVTIVPEIEMPAHSRAALVAYPELRCETSLPGGENVYCAGSEDTYAFLEDVLAEVVELFPGEFIHLGGDERPSDAWLTCPKCRAMIDKHDLADEDALQGYLIGRMTTFLEARGRRAIGWDEILTGPPPARAAVMGWRGMKYGIAAAKRGHDVVLCPAAYCYFNISQEPYEVTLERVYSFDPVPAELSAEEAAHILGIQACLWTETIATPRRAEYMAFPRASALAEVAWSPDDSRDLQDFKRRLKPLLARLRAMDVNFYQPTLTTHLRGMTRPEKILLLLLTTTVFAALVLFYAGRRRGRAV